jgi:hypothetical protein
MIIFLLWCVPGGVDRALSAGVAVSAALSAGGDRGARRVCHHPNRYPVSGAALERPVSRLNFIESRLGDAHATC